MALYITLYATVVVLIACPLVMVGAIIRTK
jgi:hypothetical protein